MVRSLKAIYVFLFLFSISAFAESNYFFEGRHFVASYYDCSDEALNDVTQLEQVMTQAIEASGATILDSTSHHFDPGGFTLAFLLSESHASIHTYPEHRSCFIDLFTCGDTCSSDAFDKFMRQYLKPQAVSTEVLLRN